MRGGFRPGQAGRRARIGGGRWVKLTPPEGKTVNDVLAGGLSPLEFYVPRIRTRKRILGRAFRPRTQPHLTFMRSQASRNLLEQFKRFSTETVRTEGSRWH